MKQFLLLSCLMLCSVVSLTAQPRVTTKGTDFWFTFMMNDPNSGNPTLIIFVTADVATTANIFVGNTQVATLNVAAGNAANYTLNAGQLGIAYQTTSGQIRTDQAVHVTANNPVTVYAFNTAQTSTDATIVLPTRVLGDEYVTVCQPNLPFSGRIRRSQVAVVGIRDQTQVEITPTAPILNTTRPAGVPFTITLNEGDVYQIQAANGDLTGTRVRTITTSGPCNPIAVFSGHQRTILPQNNGSAGGHDHLIEQIPPNTALGQNFIVVPLWSNLASGRQRVRVVASEPNTNVVIGTNLSILPNIGSSAEVEVNIRQPLVIQSTKPVLVAQFAQSYNVSFGTGALGDPFMTLVPPTEQFIDVFTFNAFVPPVNNQALWSQNIYLNILAETADMPNIRINGTPISALNTTTTNPRILDDRIADGTLRFITFRVNPGVYQVDASQGRGCAGYIYAYSTADSYGFAGGASVNNLRSFVDIVDTLACPGRPTLLEGFSLDSAVITQWDWFFPFDNSVATGKRIQKSFPDTGSYTVRLILQKGGCALDTVTDVLRIETPIRAEVSVDPDPVCWKTDATITVIPSGGVGPYGFSWTALDDDGIVSGAQDSVLTVNHDVGGAYRYRVAIADRQGCIANITATVNVLEGPPFEEADPVLICQGDIGTVTATIGGQGPHTIRWEAVDSTMDSTIIGDRTTTSIQVRSADVGLHDYIVTAVDANGCINSHVYQVEIVEIPVVVNTGANPVIQCLEDSVPPITIGDSIIVSGGQAPYTFSWMEKGGGTASITGPLDEQVTTVKPAFTTTYVLTIRGADDRIDCPVTIEVTVEVRLVPDANAGDDRIICRCANFGGVEIGELALCGRAPYEYSWEPTTGLSNPTSTVTAATMANPPQTTVYVLTVKDADGGSNKDTVTVFVEPCPSVAFDGDVTICQEDATAILTPAIDSVDASTSTYRWTPTTFLSDPTAQNPTVRVPDSTFTITYTVTVTSDKGCVGTGTITVRRSSNLSVTAEASATCETDTICRGDRVTLVGQGAGGEAPYTYAWTAVPNDPQLIANGATAEGEPLVRTTYTVTVTDAFGCMATDSVIVCVDPVPNAFAGEDTIICQSDAGVVPVIRGAPSTCGKAPFIYNWQPAALVDIPNSAEGWRAHLLPTETTTFTLTVTDDDGSGNSTTDTIVVTVRPPILITFSPDTVDICKGLATEPLLATATQGNAPYTYSWRRGTTTLFTAITDGPSIMTQTFLSALQQSATITVHVTDALGCEAVDSIRIVVREAPIVDPQTSHRICPCDTVQIGALATSGTPFSDGSYRYRWSVFEEDFDASGSISNDTVAMPLVYPRTTTTYTVVAIDSQGCVSEPAFVRVEVARPGTGTTLRADTIIADPHAESVSIPIRVVAGEQSIECPPNNIEFSFSYAEQLFDPMPSLLPGTIISNTVANVQGTPVRTLRIRIDPAPMLTQGSLITTMKGRALVGAPGRTPLGVHDAEMVYDCESIALTGADGELILDSLCENPDGSVRLLTAVSSITSIQPNPSNGQAVVAINRIGKDELTLVIINGVGVEVAAFAVPPDPTGHGSLQNVPLHVDLPNGSYRAVLRSKHVLSMSSFIIVR
jgi:hypothetical protein